MTGEQDTGNPARLPIVERNELLLSEIARLEFPADLTASRQWLVTMQAAIRYGLLPARVETRQRPGAIVNRDWLKLPPVKNKPIVETRYFVARGAYRAWRAAHSPKAAGPCFVESWLNASMPVEQSAAAKHETESQMHKRESQEIGKRLWAENPNSTKADIMKHPDMLFYVQAYKGKNTIPGWLAEIDPRPKDKRRGRPKKIPV